MPFKSKAQVRACFAQNDPNWNCHEWAKETESIKSLPEKKKQRGVENAKTAGESSNMGQNKDECFDYIASLMQKLIDKQAFVPASQAPPQANNLTQQQNQLQGQLQSDASAPIPAPTALPAAKPGIQVAPVRAPMQQSIANNTFSKLAGFGDVVKATWNSRTAKNVGDFVKQPYVWGTGAGVAATGLGSAIYNAYKSDPASAAQAVSNLKDPASPLAPLLGIGSGLLLSRLLLRKKKKEQPRPEVRTEIVERQPPQIYVPMPQISFAPMAMPKYAAYPLQDKVAKQSERSDTGKAKAVIIRGNATRDSDVSNSLYSGLHRYLKRRGFQVSEDAGEPYTLPDTTAKLWIGHSRGADRLAYAPDGIQTIAIGSRRPGAINHPEDVVDVEPEAYSQLPKQTRQAHQSWHPSFSQKLDELLAAATSKAAYSLQSMAMRDASLSRRKKKVEKQEEPDVEALPVLPTKIEVRKRKKPIVKQAAPGDMGVSYAQPKGYGSALPGQAQRQARAQRLSDARQSRKDRNLPMYASSWNVKKPVTTPAAPATAPAAPAPAPAAPTSMVQLAPRSQPTSPSQHVAMLAPTGSRMDYMDMNAGKQVTGVPKAAPGPVVASGPQFGGAFGSYANKPQPASAAPQQPVKAAPAPQPPAANHKMLAELDGIEARLKALQSPNQVPGTPKPPVLQSGITNQPSAPATAPNRMTAGISTTQPGNPANLLRPQNVLNSQATAQPMDLRRSFAVRPQAPSATPTIQASPQLSSMMGAGPARPGNSAAPAPNMRSGIASAAPGPASPTSTQGSESDPTMSQLRDQVSQYLASTHGGSANAASISPLLDDDLMARATGQASPKMRRGVYESNASPAAAVSPNQLNTAMGSTPRIENAQRGIFNLAPKPAPQAPSSASQAPPAAPQSYFDLLDQANSTERRVDQLAPSSSFLPETAGMAGSVINPMLAAGIGR